MVNHKIYASDGSYCLCRLTENEKEDYMNLLKEVSIIPGVYDIPSMCDIMWEIGIDGRNWEFSIFDQQWKYCGNIILKYPETEHPEIGIDIVGRYRNQGIAPKAIKMLARKAYEERPVDYYIIRVSSKNLHSKHVMEKMGVVPDDSEDLFFQRVVEVLKEELGEESYEKAWKETRKKLVEDDEEIYQYRYLPEIFLK